MIRAIYRWQVQSGHADSFVDAWTQGTRAIRGQIKGAQGSMLLRSQQQPTEFIAIAQWDSLADWQAFSHTALPDDEAQQRLSAVSTLVSTEVCDEIQDLVNDGV
jgi:heme-degrading monooxygenase HmoA